MYGMIQRITVQYNVLFSIFIISIKIENNKSYISKIFILKQLMSTDKISYIKDILDGNGYLDNSSIHLPKKSVNKIYKLFKNGIMPKCKKFNSSELFHIGVYYESNKKYEAMKKYFLMASDKGHTGAMFGLGYDFMERRDYNNMMHYFTMAIEKNNSDAMNGMGFYYMQQKDYKNMIKYFMLAVRMNHVVAIDNLTDYFDENKDYDNMKIFYLTIFENGDISGLKQLVKYSADVLGIDFIMKLHDKIKTDEEKIIFNEIKLYDFINKLKIKETNKPSINNSNNLDIMDKMDKMDKMEVIHI